MNTPDPDDHRDLDDHRDPSTDETAPQDQDQEPVENGGPEPEPAVDVAPETDAETETETEAAASQSTAVFVRRRGRPSLVFWVLLCLAVPAVATLVSAPLLGVSGLTAVLTVTLAAVFGIGVPLAGLCAVTDAIAHRRRR